MQEIMVSGVYHMRMRWQHAQPNQWLPFLSDQNLQTWRDIIANQICADCASQTIEILGKRVSIGAEGIRQRLNDMDGLQADLWANVPLETITIIEHHMYEAMVNRVLGYFAESDDLSSDDLSIEQIEGE